MTKSDNVFNRAQSWKSDTTFIMCTKQDKGTIYVQLREMEEKYACFQRVQIQKYVDR